MKEIIRNIKGNYKQDKLIGNNKNNRKDRFLKNLLFSFVYVIILYISIQTWENNGAEVIAKMVNYG